jgi:hypothetical protein
MCPEAFKALTPTLPTPVPFHHISYYRVVVELIFRSEFMVIFGAEVLDFLTVIVNVTVVRDVMVVVLR